jgi:hypothetical protein
MMNKRLAWNFELTTEASLVLPQTTQPFVSDLHWESRYFWKEEEIVLLHGLNAEFLEFSRYHIKHRSDSYYLLPHSDENIKQRHDELVYKPRIKQLDIATAYGKKVKLNQQSATTGKENDDFQVLLKRIHTEGIVVQVDKEALVYKFETQPKTKLELARLVIDQRIYFSLSVESPHREIVEYLSTRMVKDQSPSDYVYFLKHLQQTPNK